MVVGCYNLVINDKMGQLPSERTITLDRIMEVRVKGNNGSKYAMVSFNNELSGHFPGYTRDPKYFYRKTGKPPKSQSG
jgi:hypothetical protein